ncbi:hypothetical protein AE0388_2322 [Brevibacterium linens]|uniref:Secreted protein/lipoprotein n=1 Tax=Brevibacterium linens TaxID=1703 RepID=A0A0B9AM06_BRELN|nr:hypothetical protein AE0388_2322 [Brevibacterium linens]
MRTGSSRPHRRPARIFVAVFSALSLVSVVGCADNSPVAAPTSTLPAEQPDGGSTDKPAEVAIPDYETDLDLDKEEKKAVEGALVALDEYVATLNKAFSSGGKNTENIDGAAKGEALETLKADSKGLKKNRKYMAGEFRIEDRVIQDVSKEADEVVVLTCVDNSTFAEVDLGDPLPDRSPEPLRVKFLAQLDNSNWKIESQSLWSTPCGK